MRAGIYEESLATLERSMQGESTGNTSNAYAAFFRAMTLHHLGRNERARESLAEAIKLADQELSNESNPSSWNRRLTLELLRKEAESLAR